jgi:hypothetical protein
MGFVMNRTCAAILLATAIALPLGACGDDSSGGYYYPYDPYGCAQFTTCGACTPVPGCGWCFHGTSGVCTTDPDQCAQVTSEFTWTWDPTGCPDVDASVGSVDASPAPDTGTTGADTGSPQSDSAPAPEDVGAPQVDAGTIPSDAASSATDAGAG